MLLNVKNSGIIVGLFVYIERKNLPPEGEKDRKAADEV